MRRLHVVIVDIVVFVFCIYCYLPLQQMFQQALKESPAGSWAPRKHAVVNDGAKVFLKMQ